jgi:3-methylcrotonyl-CoA carboxylase alpha subunit
MFINYEHENHVYSVTVERRGDSFYITYDNTEYKVQATEIKPGHLQITLGDRIIKSLVTEGEKEKFVFIEGDVFKIKPVELTGRKKSTKKGEKEENLNSPISGRVVEVRVKEEQTVKKDEVLIVIEAMKMEYLIRTPYEGVVKKIHFKENDQIEIGQLTVDVKKKEK